MRVPVETRITEIEVKRSRFIAIAEPLGDVQLIRERVMATREAHPRANHVVHAAVVGVQGTQFSVGDDHEPKNTAGRPMLEVLKGSGITDVLVMVVRYFGGTLLGTGGLVKAYGDAAKAVVDGLKTEELIEKTTMTIVIGYDIYEQVKLLLIGAQAGITEDFATEVTLRVTVASHLATRLSAQVTDLSAGRARISFDQER